MTWDTDKIIGAGLICALILYLLGVFIVAILIGKVLPLDVAGNITTGLIGYMGKTLIDKVKQKEEENKK